MAYFHTNQTDRDLTVLKRLLQSSPDISRRLNVHIVYGDPDEPFPINFLRNIAVIGIQTTHTFHSDIDFVVSNNLVEYLRYVSARLFLPLGHLLCKIFFIKLLPGNENPSLSSRRLKLIRDMQTQTCLLKTQLIHSVLRR